MLKPIKCIYINYTKSKVLFFFLKSFKYYTILYYVLNNCIKNFLNSVHLT